MNISNKRQIGETYNEYRARLNKVAVWLKNRPARVLFRSTRTQVHSDGSPPWVVSLGRAKRVGTRKNPEYVEW